MPGRPNPGSLPPGGWRIYCLGRPSPAIYIAGRLPLSLLQGAALHLPPGGCRPAVTAVVAATQAQVPVPLLGLPRRTRVPAPTSECQNDRRTAETTNGGALTADAQVTFAWIAKSRLSRAGVTRLPNGSSGGGSSARPALPNASVIASTVPWACSGSSTAPEVCSGGPVGAEQLPESPCCWTSTVPWACKPHKCHRARQCSCGTPGTTLCPECHSTGARTATEPTGLGSSAVVPVYAPVALRPPLH